MSITRRVFLRNGALALAGTAAVPALLKRAVYGAEALDQKRLVVIFQRGAADGLNIVVPHGDPAYYAMRPSIAIPRESVLDLDGFFGLHPAMASLQPLWKQKHLAVVHGTGSPHATRLHLEAQTYVESGTPGLRSMGDGWLNRALRSLPQEPKSSFRAIALGPSIPRILTGAEPALALSNMSASSVNSLLHATGQESFAARALKAADPTKYKSAAGANYPRGRFGESLKELAQLIKTNLGVQVAFAEIGGWDHHVNEGSTQGQLANVLREFSEALAAFWIDLEDKAEDTIVVTMSEFGRAARENANHGTDHGHANVMFVMGGPVKGGKVYGRWPGLEQSQLHEGRDLAVTTDFRLVLGEAVSQHLGNKEVGQVFPGFESRPGEFLGLLG